MSITIFSDLVLRHAVISSGLKGRLVRKNQRVSTANGFESINIVWDRSQREFDFSTIIMLRQDWEYVETIYEITEAGAYGFLLEDPKDYTAASTTPYAVTTGVFASLGGGQYQLFKRKKDVASGRYKDRKITRPFGTDFQAFNSVGGALTGTVDPATGIATIAGSPVTWTGRFYTPVHFQADVVGWQLDAAGPPEARYYSGPSIVLEEVWE